MSLINSSPSVRIVVILICFTILPNLNYSQSGDQFSIEYRELWDRTKDYTLIMVNAMPDSLFDYKPVEDVRTFREQVGHMMDNMSFLQYYLTGNRDSPIRGISNELRQQSKDDILANLGVCFDYIGFLIENLSEEDANESVSFFVKEIEMNKRGIVRLLRNHVTHHRAQLIVYLRLNNIAPPRYVGW